MKKVFTGVSAVGLALAITVTGGSGAFAAKKPLDTDRDGISNALEIKYKLNPKNPRDAKMDFDYDGLKNIQEVKLGSNIRLADTDKDGSDDKDEIQTRTKVAIADTDRDGILDGDEDHDRDGIANEDEDDAHERGLADDADTDKDNVKDEDENEMGLIVGDPDSDDDGVLDGDEDHDGDFLLNEDEDDLDNDKNDNGAEDVGDLFGSVTSYDSTTGALVVTTVAGVEVTTTVTEDSEFEYTDAREDREEALFEETNGIEAEDEDIEAGPEALVSGAVVTEIEIDVETGELEEITLD